MWLYITLVWAHLPSILFHVFHCSQVSNYWCMHMHTDRSFLFRTLGSEVLQRTNNVHRDHQKNFDQTDNTTVVVARLPTSIVHYVKHTATDLGVTFSSHLMQSRSFHLRFLCQVKCFLRDFERVTHALFLFTQLDHGDALYPSSRFFTKFSQCCFPPLCTRDKKSVLLCVSAEHFSISSRNSNRLFQGKLSRALAKWPRLRQGHAWW